MSVLHVYERRARRRAVVVRLLCAVVSVTRAAWSRVAYDEANCTVCGVPIVIRRHSLAWVLCPAHWLARRTEVHAAKYARRLAKLAAAGAPKPGAT